MENLSKKGAQFFVEVAGGKSSSSSIQNTKNRLLNMNILEEVEHGFVCVDEDLVTSIEKNLGLKMS